VHVDLVNSGIIEDPYEKLAELGCQWVDEQDWIYRTEFDFVPDPSLSKRVLRFEGLDTICRIYLNGKSIGASDNMFVAMECDVSDVMVAGRNQLRVEFQSSCRVGRERRAAYFEREQLPANTVRFDPRAFVRKSQYMFGWDWGPCLVSAGIWRPVELIESVSRLVDVHIVQRHRGDVGVDIECRSEIDGQGTVYHFVEGFERPLRDGEVLRIARPRLWWPNGMGAQETYRVTSLLVDTPPRSSAELAGVRDRIEQRIGLRTIELIRVPDGTGESFRFQVNGRDLYALGANWIPDDSFPSRVDATRLRHQLGRARDLGMNMLRVWGGGYYECDAFYALCDELGLLVWQDFPFACSYYPDDLASCNAVREEAEEAVRRLRNHPSLAIWCGNNENQMMRDGGWEGAQLHPSRYHGERIYDGVLPEVLAKLDPGRAYIASSPTGKEKANSGTDGDQHYWEVWHGRGDWGNYADSDARFCSEFGFASAPGRAVWRAMDLGTDLLSASPEHPTARWHDKTGKGYDVFVGFVEMHYPKCRNIEDWIYYSQLNQRDALRFGIEHYRRSECCRGALIWQLNDCWPAQSWAVIDSAFCLKPAAFELRRLYASVLSSFERCKNQVNWWGILDNAHESRVATFELEVRSLSNGSLLERRALEVQLQPGERRRLATVEVGHYDAKRTVLLGHVEDRTSFTLLCEPKELELEAPKLQMRRVAAGLLLDVDRPVVDLWLWDVAGVAEFADNCLTFTGPGRRLVRCIGEPGELMARSLAGLHEIVL
jgi:beta-mannosidase